MNQQTDRHEITKKPLVYRMPGLDAVTARLNVKYRETDSSVLTMDIYQPSELQSGARTPAVVFVLGYSDVGVQKVEEMDQPARRPPKNPLALPTSVVR